MYEYNNHGFKIGKKCIQIKMVLKKKNINHTSSRNGKNITKCPYFFYHPDLNAGNG